MAYGIAKHGVAKFPYRLVHVSEALVLLISLPFPGVKRRVRFLRLDGWQSTSLVHPDVIAKERNGYHSTSRLRAHDRELGWTVLRSIAALKRLRSNNVADGKGS